MLDKSSGIFMDVTTGVDKDESLVVVYLDFHKTSDKVPHKRWKFEKNSNKEQSCNLDLPKELPHSIKQRLWDCISSRVSNKEFVSCLKGQINSHRKMHRPIQHVERVFYTILALIGIPVNSLAIVILSRSKCGVSPCTTRYLVIMAAADLMVIITDVLLRRFRYYYYPRCFLDITPVCSVNGVLYRAARDCSVWFTVTFSFDRFVTICCQKLKTKYCTEKTATVVLATTCILLCLKNIPFYFQYQPVRIINNMPFSCDTKSDYYTETWWVALDWFDTVLTPLLPFALILLFNALTVRHILVTSRVRKRLKAENKGENRRDPEMENRRKSVILLFTISGSFILLWFIYVVDFLYFVIQEMNPDDYPPFLFHFRRVGYMLQRLSCCTNTFIYAATLPRFRAKFSNAVKYLVTRIACAMNK
ncbi:probable G-protein coupled receptor 139 [Rhincodon typus]|uniref:probable G-protein coupled receptor 139 n=1 Tax=Rhincodon typus TaxID=259920 RepID=UPI00202EAFCD|nr:probable G-protein coupled receptor 139 [Rhincodon typus]